ncbi:ethanolamine ammonia-lyase subunit EutC [Acidisphaera sp. S103]|uniref:ethanolamine ammonia-lyase subunit EutC n=1 Tax=Acidisphaera sp. S103 TaxID=1747223 RepID=UPI00131C30EF|nr:ethanolamine ammonia-lyase subunit EutC [Acidisphaera sp. S103]
MSDPWVALRTTTRARIGLGRTGDALPIKDVLEFQLAHARARDAVHTPLDTEVIARAVAPLTSVMVRSKAADRETYLRRPDLGRQLGCDIDPSGPWDAVFVIADGLSPVGVQIHAPPLLHACLDRLPGWSVAPIVIATQARVALGDEIGALLQACLCVVLIGERPGLSVATSLGVYLTYRPRIGRRDSERNCISNIHADGLSYEAAAHMLVWLMTEARHRKLTGVGLKDDRPVAAPASPERLPAPHRSG